MDKGKKMLLVTILLSILINSCGSSKITIIDKPIVFDSQRQELSLEYMEERYGIIKDSAFIDPKIIVLHWTAISTLDSSFEAMNPTILPGSRTNIGKASKLNVSTQFLVDRDGSIYRLLPETAFARHVIGLNHAAIGVENVGGDNYPLTKEQLKANEKLVRYLANKYDIEYLIGHYEYQEFIGHSLWKEKDPQYRTHKIDPGKEFMNSIRQEIKDLDLKKFPQSE